MSHDGHDADAPAKPPRRPTKAQVKKGLEGAMESRRMRKGGRPLEFTPEKGDLISRAMRAGNYLETAANLAGVDVETVRQWLRWGARGKTPELAKFYDEASKATAIAETRMVGTIQKFSENEWTPAAWWLERRFPRRWGRMDRTELTGADGGPVEVVATFAELARKAARGGGGE